MFTRHLRLQGPQALPQPGFQAQSPEGEAGAGTGRALLSLRLWALPFGPQGPNAPVHSSVSHQNPLLGSQTVGRTEGWQLPRHVRDAPRLLHKRDPGGRNSRGVSRGTGAPPTPRRPGPSHPPRTHPTVRSSPKLCWETGRMASSKKAFRIENVLNSRRIIPTVTLPVRVTFETSNSKMVIKIKDSSNSFMTPTAHSRKWEPTVGRPRASSRADGARPRGQTPRVLVGRSPSSASHPGRPGLTAALFHLCASYTLAVHPSIHAASLFMPQAILGRKGTCRA